MSKAQTPSGQSVFQLVSDPSEKMTIIYDLIKSERDMIVKSTQSDAEIFAMRAMTVTGSQLLAKFAGGGVKALRSQDKELILQFQVGEQKYITQVPYKMNGEMLSLSMEKKLFRIQRREFFRLNLPASFRGVLTIDQIGGVPVKQKLSLIDISGGGCRAKSANADLPSNIGFEALLKIPGRDDFKLRCTIRHQGKVADKSGDTWVGVQFTHPSEKEASRMAAVVMDLYREYFSRL